MNLKRRLLQDEFNTTAPEDVPSLPLNALKGTSKDQIDVLTDIGISTIYDLATKGDIPQLPELPKEELENLVLAATAALSDIPLHYDVEFTFFVSFYPDKPFDKCSDMLKEHEFELTELPAHLPFSPEISSELQYLEKEIDSTVTLETPILDRNPSLTLKRIGVLPFDVGFIEYVLEFNTLTTDEVVEVHQSARNEGTIPLGKIIFNDAFEKIQELSLDKKIRPPDEFYHFVLLKNVTLGGQDSVHPFWLIQHRGTDINGVLVGHYEWKRSSEGAIRKRISPSCNLGYFFDEFQFIIWRRALFYNVQEETAEEQHEKGTEDRLKYINRVKTLIVFYKSFESYFIRKDKEIDYLIRSKITHKSMIPDRRELEQWLRLAEIPYGVGSEHSFELIEGCVRMFKLRQLVESIQRRIQFLDELQRDSLSTRLTIFFGVISSLVIFDTLQSIVERLIPENMGTWILILDIFKVSVFIILALWLLWVLVSWMIDKRRFKSVLEKF